MRDETEPSEAPPMVPRVEMDFLDELIQRVFEVLFTPGEDAAAEIVSLAEVYQFDYECRNSGRSVVAPDGPLVGYQWRRHLAGVPAAGRN